MLRGLLVAFATVLALGLWPRHAAADEACTVVATAVGPERAFDPWIGGMSGISAMELVVVPRQVPAGTELDVLWCQGSDDPRCVPVHRRGDGDPQLGQLELRAPGPTSVRPRAQAPTRASFLPCDRGPREGVARRVERPPRH